MACTIRRLPSFERQFKDICKQFPNSQAAVDQAIENLKDNPQVGNAFPGFGKIQVRKHRIALKAYNIGESGGLRLIFMVAPDKNVILPLILYKKGQISSEKEVIKATKDKLKEALKELQN